LVLAAICAAPASAAFPGRDGLLAVQPVNGGGMLLVNAQSGSQHRICTSKGVCGSPKDPRWSPNGRALAFSGPAVRLIYPDGSCLDCQLGSAGTPAFTANPTLVSFESDGALVEDGIDDIRKATIVKGQFSDAVWSARGELAVVRGGSVWAGSPHKLRRIGAGSSPSWSPSGAQLALVRGGSIFVVNLHTHAGKRLVRGTAPAWSPDGKSIAFIAPGHRLSVVPASGGATRPVGSVRGDSVDWQPVPKKTPAGCLAPPGSKVIASSSSAIVTSDSSSAGTAVLGCLRANGRERFLELDPDSPGVNAQSVSAAAVGDGYAALANLFDDLHYGNSYDSVAVFNLSTGALVPGMGGEEASCPGQAGGENCVSPNIDHLVVGPDGVSAAHLTTVLPAGTSSNPLVGVSCPSASLCVAVDGVGHLFTTTNPTGGVWTEASVPGLVAVSCPSASLCVGVTQIVPALGGSISTIYTSTDPTGGSGAWTAGYTVPGVNDAFTAVSCPSVSFCAAVNAGGNVVTSTSPAGGAAAWTAADINGTGKLAGISCPSAALCVATDENGHVISSTNPTGGASTWQTATALASGTGGPQDLSCPSTALCVGIGPGGPVFASTSPTTSGSWVSQNLPVDLNAVDCPSTSLCVAVGGEGALLTSTNPAAGIWGGTQIDNANDLDSVSCASASLCVTGDADGNLVTSANPTGGAAAWNAMLVDGSSCSAATTCTTEQIVDADSTGVHVLDASNQSGTGPPPLLTDLSLSGDTLTWKHAGTPETARTLP
jgi:hypothetical protein